MTLKKTVEAVAEAAEQLRIDVFMRDIAKAENPADALAGLSDADLDFLLAEAAKDAAPPVTVRRWGDPVLDLLPDADYFRLANDPAYKDMFDIDESVIASTRLLQMRWKLRQEAEAQEKRDRQALHARVREEGRRFLSREEMEEQKDIERRFQARLAEIEAMQMNHTTEEKP